MCGLAYCGVTRTDVSTQELEEPVDDEAHSCYFDVDMASFEESQLDRPAMAFLHELSCWDGVFTKNGETAESGKAVWANKQDMVLQYNSRRTWVEGGFLPPGWLLLRWSEAHLQSGLLLVADVGAVDLPPTTGWESLWLGDMDHNMFLKLQFGDEVIEDEKFPVDDFPTPTDVGEQTDDEDELQAPKEEPEAEAEATADHYMIKCGTPVTHSQGVGDGICDMGHSEWSDVE